jgi:hypothetical protein
VSDGGKTCENELTKKCGNGILSKIVKKKLMFRSLILHSIHAAETRIELTYAIDERNNVACTLSLSTARAGAEKMAFVWHACLWRWLNTELLRSKYLQGDTSTNMIIFGIFFLIYLHQVATFP